MVACVDKITEKEERRRFPQSYNFHRLTFPVLAQFLVYLMVCIISDIFLGYCLVLKALKLDQVMSNYQ